MTDKPREKKSKSCWVLDGRYFFQLESDKEINVFGSDDKRRPFDALWQKSCRHWCRVGIITAIEPRWLLFWSCGLIWYDMPMSLAWFMLEDPSITKSFHQKNLPWPSSSHHWIHQVADYLTSSHTCAHWRRSSTSMYAIAIQSSDPSRLPARWRVGMLPFNWL